MNTQYSDISSAPSIPYYAKDLKVLIVDDNTTLRETTKSILDDLFMQIHTAEDGKTGLSLFMEYRHDIVIADISMPVMNGIDMVNAIREINPDQMVIFISGQHEIENFVRLINMGIGHFLMKPFKQEELFQVLDKALKLLLLQNLEKDYQKQLEDAVSLQTGELREALHLVKNLSDELALRLSVAAEHRDFETGAHIQRIGIYGEFIARELGMPEDFSESVRFAAPLHDIGKIGIPDNVLLKEGPLTVEEFEIMKNHTHIGSTILKGSSIDKIKMAHRIALHHHEKYDGTGYPLGLSGESISLEGRIIALCDNYDA
ncbi:MAG TPA: response regulator, partial [Spirochaetota bacterium]|nr:response regulator [Spirochaetota bacterium]